MLDQSKQRLIYFDEGLLAIHRSDATLLEEWSRKVFIENKIGCYFELINLQKYKKINDYKKVSMAMREYHSEPFMFFICKN